MYSVCFFEYLSKLHEGKWYIWEVQERSRSQVRYAEGIRELDVSMGLCQTSASWGGATTALVLGPQSIVLGWGTMLGKTGNADTEVWKSVYKNTPWVTSCQKEQYEEVGKVWDLWESADFNHKSKPIGITK